ncbi:MAG: HD domain-containing protein [Candidatus Micrarchaeota archaeon]|nr:HD domain-containing protein [Candidatus Micrarchaeota archaeon]
MAADISRYDWMIKIRDPLHGSVAISELEERILDCPQMQRLRGIRQLAAAYLVYPGANHTRFEHSIGTMALADKICRELRLEKEETQMVRVAALLHDIGHVCFSHEGESILAPYIGDHEKIGRKMIQEGQIKDIISEQYCVKKIANVENGPLGKIISADIGADRMDYLLRDSHYTGVAYGVIDADRLSSCLEFSEKELVLQERGLEAAESLLVARYIMFFTVYLHKTVRIANRMLQRALELAIEGGHIRPKDALGMTDAQMLQALLEAKESRPYAEGIAYRRLYKKAYSSPKVELAQMQKEIEERLSSLCGCDVLVDFPSVKLGTSINVKTDEGLMPISKCSELVASLEKIRRLEALVICQEKNTKKVAKKAEELFASL